MQGAGRGRGRVYRQEAALTLNWCVRVCARSRVSTRMSACVSLGEGDRLETNHGLRGAEPSAPPSRRPQEFRALKPFMILVTLFQEWARGGRGLPRPSPAPAPINTASRALCGAASSVENRELRALCRRSWQWGCLRKADRRTPSARTPPPAAPVCAPDILTRDAVTVFKSQGRGSASPRTSCLYISPFTGEYPAPSAGIRLAAMAAGPGRLLLRARVRGQQAALTPALTRRPSPCRSQRQGCKGGGGGGKWCRERPDKGSELEALT